MIFGYCDVKKRFQAAYPRAILLNCGFRLLKGIIFLYKTVSEILLGVKNRIPYFCCPLRALTQLARASRMDPGRSEGQLSSVEVHFIIGGLAQLARAFAWHAKGHRFDSGNLHFNSKRF